MPWLCAHHTCVLTPSGAQLASNHHLNKSPVRGCSFCVLLRADAAQSTAVGRILAVTCVLQSCFYPHPPAPAWEPMHPWHSYTLRVYPARELEDFKHVRLLRWGTCHSCCLCSGSVFTCFAAFCCSLMTIIGTTWQICEVIAVTPPLISSVVVICSS